MILKLGLLQIFLPTRKLYDAKCIHFYVKKTKVDLELIKKPTKILFLKGCFRQCLALEVVMCHKNAEDCGTTDPGSLPNQVFCYKGTRFLKRIKSGRIFSVLLNEMKEYNF